MDPRMRVERRFEAREVAEDSPEPAGEPPHPRTDERAPGRQSTRKPSPIRSCISLRVGASVI